MGIQHLYVLWMVIISGHVCGGVELLARHVGESVVLQCQPDGEGISPYAVYLKRCWLRPAEVLFMHTQSRPSVSDSTRIHVSGDPSNLQVNVTISELRPTDTDRYCCEFVVVDMPFDRVIPGKVEFFLYIANDPPSSADVVHVETLVGGSAVLPCTRPLGEGQQMAVEGFSLKRQKSSAPVEMLYHSKYHHQLHHNLVSSTTMLPSPSSFSPSPFPAERLRLTMAPAVGGMTFNLTLLQLQPRDSGFYSCTLLLASRPQASASLGLRVFYVSVQAGQRDCSTYTTLLYALSAAVAVMLLLLLLAVAMYWVKAATQVKPQAQTAIYEEMVGVRPPKLKMGGLGTFHLEEVEVSEYSNSHVAKPRAENHYESPSLSQR